MKILLIAPLLDIPTITSNLAVENILEHADTKFGVDIDLLWGIFANRFLYDIKTAFKKYDLIVYYGHGEQNKLMGNHLLWSIINKRNIKRTKDTPFDTMACLSARELGGVAVRNGSRAYVGSLTPYFGAFPEKERNYLNDWIDYTTIRTKMLMDGATFGEAFNEFKRRGEKYLKIYKAHANKYNYDWYAKSLESNLNNTILIGDPNTRIV